MEACYGGTDVMERSCAVARGIDINIHVLYFTRHRPESQHGRLCKFRSQRHYL
jgi:hypothetical protein